MKRAKILKATLELISKQGIHATPMSEIAREAGVAAGSIYTYFPGKNELISALYLDLKQEASDAILAADDPELAYQDRFFLFWLNSFKYLSQNPLKFSFLEQIEHSPFLTEELKTEGDMRYKGLIEFIDQGIAPGYLKPMPLEMAFALAYGSVVAIVKFHLNGKVTLDNDDLQMAMFSCWEGLVFK